VPAAQVALQVWLNDPVKRILTALVGFTNDRVTDEFTVTFHEGVALTAEGVLVEVALQRILYTAATDPLTVQEVWQLVPLAMFPHDNGKVPVVKRAEEAVMFDHVVPPSLEN